MDLGTHITDVVNATQWEDLTAVTLVGWSYGGMIITGVADRVPERLARLVYLDARFRSTVSTSTTPICPRGASHRDRAAAEAARYAGFLVVEHYREWIES